MFLNITFVCLVCTFWASFGISVVKDETLYHNWDDVEPLGEVDNSFIHHTELLKCIEEGQLSFSAFDIHHIKKDAYDKYPFLNLAFGMDLNTESRFTTR